MRKCFSVNVSCPEQRETNPHPYDGLSKKKAALQLVYFNEISLRILHILLSQDI